MTSDNALIGIIVSLRNDVTYLIVFLTIQTSLRRRIGRTILVVCTTGLVLATCRTRLRCIPRIPLVRVVDIVGQDIARFVADIVRRTEDIVEIDILVSRDMVNVRSISFQSFVFTGQQYGTGLIGLVTYLTVGNGYVGLWNKQFLLSSGELTPIPVVDDIVETVRYIVQLYLVVLTERYILRFIVGIKVRLHIQQRHLTMRGRRDGQRDANRLAEGVRTAGIG